MHILTEVPAGLRAHEVPLHGDLLAVSTLRLQEHGVQLPVQLEDEDQAANVGWHGHFGAGWEWDSWEIWLGQSNEEIAGGSNLQGDLINTNSLIK